MKLDKEYKKLLYSEYIRVFLTLIILLLLNIPIFIKIILIMLLDKLDCSHMSFPYTGPLLTDNTNICKTMIYQKMDKITDTICYTILLLYIIKYGKLNDNYNYFIIILFIYRLIGTYLFIIKNNKKYLFYFPNFFLEICLYLMFINYYPNLRDYENIIILCIFIYKLIIEYFLHVY